MGNQCTNYYCCQKEKDINTELDMIFDQTISKNEKHRKIQKIDQAQSNDTTSIKLIDQTETKIVIIQRFWRRYNKKKKLNIIKKSATQLKVTQKSSFQYFNDNIIKSENQSNISNAVREKRPIFRFRSDATYLGEWLGYQRDGFGIQQWPDGAKYEGQWENNEACGQGIFQHANGDIYKGTWKNNKANGYGIYQHQSGIKYEGQWKDDFQHGLGKEMCKYFKFVNIF